MGHGRGWGWIVAFLLGKSSHQKDYLIQCCTGVPEMKKCAIGMPEMSAYLFYLFGSRLLRVGSESRRVGFVLAEIVIVIKG